VADVAEGCIRGLLGRPFVCLDDILDLTPLDAIHEEICVGLTQVPVDYTGGSHRSMGIVPPSLARLAGDGDAEAGADYGEVLRGLDDAGFAVFRSLADDAVALDVAIEAVGDRRDLEFGEERAYPLSRRQMLWLKVRHGVYFPWKGYVELIPNRHWSEKSSAEGKAFTRVAKTFFPKTIAFAQSLPFESIGRCNIMGLEANDHGTVHRDGDPDAPSVNGDGMPAHFITFCPAANKRVFLWDEALQAKTPVTGRAYWFNDHDYHGVDADPFFRYSVRVDGVFKTGFAERLGRPLETGGRG